MSTDGLRKWMWTFLVTLIAAQFYFVRQLFGALMLVAMVFGAVFAMIAAVYLIHRASGMALAGMRKSVRPMLGFARRGLVLADGISRKPFRRPRSEPVQ